MCAAPSALSQCSVAPFAAPRARSIALLCGTRCPPISVGIDRSLFHTNLTLTLSGMMTRDSAPVNSSSPTPQDPQPDNNPYRDDAEGLDTDAQLYFTSVLAFKMVAQRRAAGEELPTSAYLISSSDGSTPSPVPYASPTAGPSVLHEAPATAEADVFLPDMLAGTKRGAANDGKDVNADRKLKQVRLGNQGPANEAKRSPNKDGDQPDTKTLHLGQHALNKAILRGQREGSVLTARRVQAQHEKREREAAQHAAAQNQPKPQFAPPSHKFLFQHPRKYPGHPAHTFGHPAQEHAYTMPPVFRPTRPLANHGHNGHVVHYAGPTYAQHTQAHQQAFSHPAQPNWPAHRPPPVPAYHAPAAAAIPASNAPAITGPDAGAPEPARAELAIARLLDRKGKRKAGLAGKRKAGEATPGESAALEGLVELGQSLPEPAPLPPSAHPQHFASPSGSAGPSRIPYTGGSSADLDPAATGPRTASRRPGRPPG